MKQTATLLFLLIPLLWFGCSKQTVEPEFTGSIEGRVQNSLTGAGIAFAGITTNPGTDAILTDADGQFTITDIPTGNYTVQATKDNFATRTVRVAVNEDRAASAQILLTSEDEDPNNEVIEASVTNFFNTSRNDSSFVEVEFVVSNNSANTNARNFEVYFQIFTAQTTFFEEFEGDSLRIGQQEVGEFTKFIRQFSADSVVVSGTFADDGDS